MGLAPAEGEHSLAEISWETFSELAGGCRILDDFGQRIGVRDHHDM